MELLENLAGGFGPDERRWSLVPMSDKGLDVIDELRDGVEGSPADRLTGKDTKPRFDKIHPRSSGGREMKMDAGMCGQPGLDVGGGVGRGVVDDRVQVATREAASQLLEEAEEVWSAVGLRALADDLASRHLQSSPGRLSLDRFAVAHDIRKLAVPERILFKIGSCRWRKQRS